MALLALAAGCSEGDPVPGGGDRKITGIRIGVVGEGNIAWKDGVKVKVGETVQLRVSAIWAIPSVTDETARAKLDLLTPEAGKLTADAKFTAARPGEARLKAAYKGFTDTLTLVVED